MHLKAFDHVNVRTANLGAMVEWYGRVLGMMPGKRPGFPFPGAWLYLGEDAIIHPENTVPDLPFSDISRAA